MTKATLFMLGRLSKLGFSVEEQLALRRIAMTFSRWDEAECGNSDNYKSWAIVRDEENGKPYMEIHPHTSNEVTRYRIPDREAGAQKRLDMILSNHPELWSYHQSDPRGASLYIGRKSDLNGGDLHAIYTRGVAVFK